MNSDQLVTLCQRHRLTLLLTSDADMISIAVVGNPAAEMMEALRFATQNVILNAGQGAWKTPAVNRAMHTSVVLTAQHSGYSQPHPAAEAINQRF